MTMLIILIFILWDSEMPCHVNNPYIYIHIRGVTVHRCHGSVHTSVRGVTVRYNFGSTRKIQQIYYARFLFIYFEQTVVQITILSHLDVKILNIILNYNVIYKNLQYIYI